MGITAGTFIALDFRGTAAARRRETASFQTGGIEMDLLKRLCVEEDGQGLIEYTFVVVLVALVFWMGVRDANVGTSLANGWSRVLDCVASPFSCSA